MTNTELLRDLTVHKADLKVGGIPGNNIPDMLDRFIRTFGTGTTIRPLANNFAPKTIKELWDDFSSALKDS